MPQENRWIFGTAIIVLVAIAAIYWPVVHADFVWDDWPSFHDKPWLTQGDNWKHYIFRDFNSWTFYFRPLVVAFLTLQVRLFDSSPGPMHVVSLVLHLIDTLLVGLLSWRCGKISASNIQQRTWMSTLCMLLYGLHPVLIEPVAWIGCQFDLIATMLMLLGLLASTGIQRDAIRAMTVTAAFFLAACAKESAVSLPPLIMIFDWALLPRNQHKGILTTVRVLIHRNWLTYVGMFFAGLAYLALRHWALGEIENPFKGNSVTALARMQEICLTYLSYWKMLIWPMPGMSPIHPVDDRLFGTISSSFLLVDVIVIGVVASGIYFTARRVSPLGCIVVATTAALLPVLHIATVDFERSLYHERYAMMALAVICAMLPLLWRPHFGNALGLHRLAAPLLAIATFFWLAFAMIDIHIIVPKWANDVNLWQWALSKNPHASQAKDNLLQTYLKNRDYADARQLGDRLLADSVPCANCMLYVAKLAVDDKDTARAAIALEKVRRSPLLVMDKGMLHTYYLTTGRMLILKGQLDDAEQVLHAAVSLDPLDPQSQNLLAIAVALKTQNKSTTGDRSNNL